MQPKGHSRRRVGFRRGTAALVFLVGPPAVLSAPAFADVSVAWTQPARGQSIAVDAADNVFTVDYEQALGAEMTLTKRASDGTLLWQASHDQTDGTKWERAAWVAADGAGNALVAGTLMSGYSSPVEAASIVMKFDPQGALLWRRVYESEFDGSSVRKVLVDAEGNVYVLGLGSGPPGFVTKVKKFAPDGTPLWNFFDADGIGAPVNFKLTPDGHLVIAARSIFGSLNGYAKIDLDGNKVWSLAGVQSLTVGDAAGDSLGNTYVVHGEFVAGGGTVIRKLDPAGATLWQAVEPLSAFRVEVGSDDRPVASGFPNSGGAGAAFVKLDENGGRLWLNSDADGPLSLLLHAHMLIDDANDAYLAAGTLFEMAVCKVRSDGTAAWTATVTGGYASAIALGHAAGSVFVVGGATARLDDTGAPPVTITADDSEPAFMVLSGTWGRANHANAHLGGARFARAGSGAGQAGWRVDSLVPPGLYDVYVFKFEHERPAAMATDARFKVRHRDGTTPFLLVDQSAPGSEWVHLGRFPFDATRAQGVLVSDRANGYVIADAVRLVSARP